MCVTCKNEEKGICNMFKLLLLLLLLYNLIITIMWERDLNLAPPHKRELAMLFTYKILEFKLSIQLKVFFLKN